LRTKSQLIEQLIDVHERERAAWAEERHEWQLERRELLNRIQAPETAAYQAAGEPSEEPLYVPFDDDSAHDQYVEQRANGNVN